jgi:hypothetical protein
MRMVLVLVIGTSIGTPGASFAYAGTTANFSGLGEFSGGRCYQVRFYSGGGSNFCVPSGQFHQMWVKQGDTTCINGSNCGTYITIVRREGDP